MPTMFRIANKVPWDADYSPDWGKQLSETDATKEQVQRARKHRGEQYRIRIDSNDYGKLVSLKQLDDEYNAKLEKMKVGEKLYVWALDDNMKWITRKIVVEPKLMETVGNDDIDRNHTVVFRELDIDGSESWGICVRRYISGTTTWSQHCPWPDGGSNAEDFHHPSSDRMWEIARALSKSNKCGKILYAASEWTPEMGEFRYIGSYINHYDHVHAEGLRTRTGYPSNSC